MKILPMLVLLTSATLLWATPPAAGTDFRNRMVSNKNFLKADLGKSKFERVRFNDANFSGTNLSEVRFRQSDFAGSDFRAAKFSQNTNFYQCALNGTNFEGTDLGHANFHKVNFQGANLRNTKNWGQISHSTFMRADLRGADFSTAKGNFKRVKWQDAVYDEKTVFPPGIIPNQVGARKANKQ